MLIAIGASAVIVSQFDKISDVFVSSYRFANFTENLPYLNTVFKIVFGLGFIDAQDFGAGTTGLGHTFYVDNYFLYVLLTLGVLGLAIFILLIYRFGKRFLEYCRNINDTEAVVMISILMGHLFSSIGETSFLYYAFPSTALYFSCYLAFLGSRINRK